jgi:hypothetical protein
MAAKEKAPLTAKDLPDAPMGRPTRDVSVILVWCVKTTMTNLGSTTTAVVLAIRALDQTVPTVTTRMLFLQPSIVGFSPVRKKRR